MQAAESHTSLSKSFGNEPELLRLLATYCFVSENLNQVSSTVEMMGGVSA
jgi:hypothetical protein